MSNNLTNLLARKGIDNNLFERVQYEITSNGSLSSNSVKQLAEDYLIGKSNILGTASFYDFLKPKNFGKKAYVCSGTACLLAGKQDLVHSKLLDHFDQSEIGEICCLGRCHENAAFQHDLSNYSGTAIDQLAEIIDGTASFNNQDKYHQEAIIADPLLMSPITDLHDYYELLLSMQKKSKDELVHQVIESGLRGRGGAGYPIGLKMKACKQASGDRKYIVCNADEGDPGSYSDRFLLEQYPHAVLFGMLASGYISGATQGVLYIRAEYPETIKIIEKAVNEYYAIRKTLGLEFSFDFKIIEGAGSYVCGEETALLASIEGQRPEVRIRPPFPTDFGLYGKPTLVNNVETLANLHYILENGADAFSSIGKATSTGTKLICLDSFFKRPGVYEVPFGMPLQEVIRQIGRGFKIPVKALHIGGPLGGVIPSSAWDTLTLDFESFEMAGYSLGHASFISIPSTFPMIRYLEHLFAFTAHESCGKCFPCRLGSQRGMELLQKSQKEKEAISKVLFTDLLETLELGSLCGLGSGLPLPVRNILTHFSEELRPYFKNE